MPHIVFEKLVNPFIPKRIGSTEFVCEAISPHESKIVVKTLDGEFLLTKKEKSSKSSTVFEILKSDKSTRPSKAYVIKKVLQDFKDAYGIKTTFENINNLKDNTKQSNEFLKEIDYFMNSFKPSQEVWVEIGFGSGRHLLYQAKKNPNITFVGLEIHTPSIEQVLKQIELQDIKNVLILNYDARLFL
ncbi:MAG: tRNA (guanosine(46)-N7)-methyltransferase TrmB, partial [Arcobacteraceae bacterium]